MLFKDYGKNGDNGAFTRDLRALADAIDARTALTSRIEINTTAEADRMTRVRIVLDVHTGFPVQRRTD